VKKGIAIQTILLVSIGVLVAGIVVYLVYKYASGSVISEAECNARITEACIVCKSNNWSIWPSTNPTIDPENWKVNENFYRVIWKCASEHPKFSHFSGVGPGGCQDMKKPCKMFGIE
jgi:hypothetical protein